MSAPASGNISVRIPCRQCKPDGRDRAHGFVAVPRDGNPTLHEDRNIVSGRVPEGTS
jgi:hypothetical protein